MDWLIFGGILVVGIALMVVAQLRGWIDLGNKSARSGGSGGGLVAIGDEVFNPARYESQLEQDHQTLLPAPAPVAGDGAGDIYKGRVTIRL